MHDIFLAYSDTINTLNYKRLVEFLASICNEMTCYVMASYYPFLKEEYEIAVSDLTCEMIEEDNKRRLQYKEELFIETHY